MLENNRYRWFNIKKYNKVVQIVKILFWIIYNYPSPGTYLNATLEKTIDWVDCRCTWSASVLLNLGLIYAPTSTYFCKKRDKMIPVKFSKQSSYCCTTFGSYIFHISISYANRYPFLKMHFIACACFKDVHIYIARI